MADDFQFNKKDRQELNALKAREKELAADIAKLDKKSADYIKDKKKAEDEITESKKKQAELSKTESMFYSETVDLIKTGNNLMKSKEKEARKIEVANKSFSAELGKQIRMEGAKAQMMNSRIGALSNEMKVLAEKKESEEGLTPVEEESLELLAEKRNLAVEVQKLYDDMGNGMMDLNGMMDKAQELQANKAEYLKTLSKAEYKNIVETLNSRIAINQEMEGEKKILGSLDELTGSQGQAAWDSLQAFKGLGLKMGIFAAGAALAVFLITKLAEMTNEIGAEFGAIGVKDFEGDLNSARTAAIGLGYDFTDVVSSVNAMTGELGIGIDEASELSKVTMDTARALGMSSDEAATLTAILATTTGLSAEGAQNFLKQTALLAKASGVAPKDVMADMAASSEEIASFSKDGGDNMGEAAVKARQMGMALSDVAGIAEGLLNFQSSLEAELTASVMIGRQLNFQRARELALAGDLVGMQNEILTQVGSEAEWNEMNSLARKAMADSLGISVVQMSKMVKHAGKTKEEMMSISQMDAAELVSADAIANVTLLQNKFKQIGYEILADIGDWFNENEDVVESITNTVKSLGKGLAFIVKFAMKWHMALLGIYGTWKLIQLSAFLTGNSISGMIKNKVGGTRVAGMVKDKVKGFFGGGSKTADFQDKAGKWRNKKGQFTKAPKTVSPTADVGGTGGAPEKGIGDKLKDLAGGLKAMGNTKVLFGALNLIPTSLGFVALIPGIPGLLFMGKVGLPQLLPNFTGLAAGLTMMGTGSVLKGVGVTALMGLAMLLALPAIPFLALMALPLGPLWAASFVGLSTGLSALGSNIGPVLLGILALGLMGVAMIPAAYAFSLLAGIDPMSIIAFSLSLLILGAAVFGLGMIMFSGVGALIFGAGILALVALGAAVLLLGIGMSLASPHLITFTTFLTGLGTTMEGVTSQIDNINLLGESLRSLAGGLMMVGLAGIFAKPALQILDKLGITGNKTEEAGDTAEDPMVVLNSKMDTLLTKFNKDSEWVKAIVFAIDTGAVKTGKSAGRESTKVLSAAATSI